MDIMCFWDTVYLQLNTVVKINLVLFKILLDQWENQSNDHIKSVIFACEQEGICIYIYVYKKWFFIVDK